ncbi:unnamed protein product, partial [Didymodactylos carnosus]
LKFDPGACGVGLFISDENTHLRTNINTTGWRTCRTLNSGWTEGIHYWSMRIVDRGPNGHIMTGVVNDQFDMGQATYPGENTNGYGLYLHNMNKYNGGGAAFSSDSASNGDVIGTLLDLEARTVTYFKNGRILGTAFGMIPQGKQKYYPAVGMYELGNWVSVIRTINGKDSNNVQ